MLNMARRSKLRRPDDDDDKEVVDLVSALGFGEGRIPLICCLHFIYTYKLNLDCHWKAMWNTMPYAETVIVSLSALLLQSTQ